jgi:hypothetical protein
MFVPPTVTFNYDFPRTEKKVCILLGRSLKQDLAHEDKSNIALLPSCSYPRTHTKMFEQ